MGSFQEKVFGYLPDGRAVRQFCLSEGAIRLCFLNYGGIITHWFCPDQDGNQADVVLGFDSLAPYLHRHPYFGAVVGRYANRIAGGTFHLGGRTYPLAQNNGQNHLHGGREGFDKMLWTATPFQNEAGLGVQFCHESPAGHEGYPGRLQVEMTYLLASTGVFSIAYAATTDAPTVLSLTNHSYFNLTGNPRQSVLGHIVQLPASYFTPVRSDLIPTGILASVAGTPFDFRQPQSIGSRLHVPDPQLQYAGGYDHNWVLKTAHSPALQLAAQVWEPTTGRKLTVETDEVGLQFYTGNALDGTLCGKNGILYARQSGFSLETQHYPDSPNQPSFPSAVLHPGERYQRLSRYTFSLI